MRFSVPTLVLCLLGGLASCQRPYVTTGASVDLDLDGVVKVSLPAQFARLTNVPQSAAPEVGVAFLGDHAGPPEDQNFWAVTHAFAFRQNKDVVPAMLIVARVADKQSFAAAQLFYEAAARFSPDRRWAEARRLDWTQKVVDKSLSYYEAVISPEAKVTVMVDRNTLLEVLLIGENVVLPKEVAREVLAQLRDNYHLQKPLEEYFAAVGKGVQAAAEKRRKHYLELLETLQKEELDYTPTPRVVMFNPNLAAQFFWPMFDRSGVPTSFAIAARLGTLKNPDQRAWSALENDYPGMRLIASKMENGTIRWSPLTYTPSVPARARILLEDTQWSRNADDPQAYATLQFAFGQTVEPLSNWLNGAEVVARQSETKGLVARPVPD